MLECREVSVSYGGLLAVKPTSLHVERGQLVGLIGPNGAGKTTLIDALTGFVRSAGAVVFDGRDLSGLRPHRRVQAGLGRTFQSLELFDDLTVRENLLVAAEPARWWSPLVDVVRLGRRGDVEVEAALRAVSAEVYADALPSELPNGVRKLIAVARALAAKPSMILLDEPAAGLDGDESRLLGTELRQLVDGGLGMLLVDHDMGLVLSVCDYLYVLDFGVVIAEGTPAAVRNDERVIRAYLGSGTPA
jgi:branched-chain amino acid transport system ATP-binding protein